MEELNDLYSQKEIEELLTKYTLEEIKEYSKPRTVTVGSIQKELEQNNKVYVDSPDGYVNVSDFVYKGYHPEYKVLFDNKELKVSGGHRLQTPLGWEHVQNLYDYYEKDIDIHVLHKSGEYKKVDIEYSNKEIPIVDIIVDHPNHSYYSEDLVSHNTNVGKSALMCYLSGELMKMNKNVLYITMEMAEDVVYERVEANLMNLTTDEIKGLSREDYLKGIDKIKGKTNGNLVVKEYPTSGAHSGHFRHLLKELRQKKKFKPDIVFIDYINICASSRYTSGANVNSYTYVKSIAEELRGLGVEFSVPVFSATQTNRCLKFDTKISTKNGIKEIKDIVVGDEVKTFNGWNEVQKVWPKTYQEVYTIQTENGNTIQCSGNHIFPIFDKDENKLGEYKLFYIMKLINSGEDVYLKVE